MAGDRFGQCFGERVGVFEGMEAIGGCRAHQFGSCQVRPSRSISATEPDGPQVPAV
jgi:hypothetical protein